MKRSLYIIALVAGFGATSLTLHSQVPAPVVVAIAGTTPLEQLKALRDQNAKILEQQAATLLKLEEIEKTSQTVKVLGRRT